MVVNVRPNVELEENLLRIPAIHDIYQHDQCFIQKGPFQD